MLPPFHTHHPTLSTVSKTISLMVAAEPAQFLGLDLSTQQLKAIVISEDASVLHECAVHFDRDLPRYGTTNGAIAGPDGEVTSPVVMWLEALDLLMKRMKMAGVNFSAISAISGAGQVRLLHSDSFSICVLNMFASNMAPSTGPLRPRSTSRL